MEVSGIESTSPSTYREKEERRNISHTLVRMIFAGGMLLGSAGSRFKDPEEYENERGRKKVKSSIVIKEIPQFNSTSEINIELEEYVEETEILMEESLHEVPLEEEFEVEELEVEEELSLPEILNQEVLEILSLQPNLHIDNDGILFFQNQEDEETPVLMIETDRYLHYPYESVKEVRFFVIHYDGGPLTLLSDNYRTVLNTINGLNREGNPSVHFCVDPYPLSDNFKDDEGVGIIHSQDTAYVPFKGRHVLVGIELETGREDMNRVKTADVYNTLGVGNNFRDFVYSGEKDFDSYSLGVEQVGTKFSENFPHQFPPNQQIANILALSKAVALRYNLTVWDIVGHHEIQEKGDPGDEYMLTLRYLLGLEYVLSDDLPIEFLEEKESTEYFSILRKIALSRMGEERYMEWDSIYNMDTVIDFLKE